MFWGGFLSMKNACASIVALSGIRDHAKWLARVLNGTFVCGAAIQ
jgi:hypothetical protein